MNKQTQFEVDDHRKFNRHGEAFDKGETFSGVDYDLSLRAVEELRSLVPEGWTMAQFALRWILMYEAVTCTIPGSKRPSQAQDNFATADLPPIPEETMANVSEIYSRLIKNQVHHLW
jgi:aryl-alcohol dehydrogenase-like predicted oxidoreductase